MNSTLVRAALLAAVTAAPLYPEETAAPAKPSVQLVQVEDGVKLEVADWGGTGRTLILLGGLGATYHEFDGFGPKLAAKYHVLGITRRGFGGSSVPATGYTADRLGDDVVAVIDALKLNRPVLVGHSMAGEELSSVGSRHPEKIAGLVYVEAAYAYAFYDPAVGDLTLDSIALKQELAGLLPGNGRPDQQHLTEELLQTMAQVERELKERREQMKGMEDPPRPQPGTKSVVPVPIQGIFVGEQKFTEIHAPVLAIFALPHDLKDFYKDDPAGLAKAEADDAVRVGAQADAFQKGVPSAHVARIAHASHFIFGSNEADVLREMDAFLGSLPP